MGMTNAAEMTVGEILNQVVRPQISDLHPEAAREFLRFKFDRTATSRIRALLRKNNRGTITAGERVLLGKYLRVGQFIDLLQAKATLTIQGLDDAP